MNQLEVIDFSKRLSEKIILNKISATISPGITGILGANGAGKSTLLRMLAGLLPLDSGYLLYNGERIDLHSQFWREKIGYLPQSPSLYERMSAEDFLDYMLLLSGWGKKPEREKRILEVMHYLNLMSFMGVPIGQLSGGTKQRVAIGQSIIHEPNILLLDEPTNNLDPEERNRFQNRLITYAKDKFILYVGHIVNELVVFCSKIMIIAEGKIEFYDTAEKLIRSMNGHIKELRVSESEMTKLSNSFKKIICIGQIDSDYIVRYDTRFNSMTSGAQVMPTLEEAYHIFLNSLELNNQ